MQVSFQGLGWQIKLQKRTNYFLTLVKEVVFGNALKRGNTLFYYLVTCNKRKAIEINPKLQQKPRKEKAEKGIITQLAEKFISGDISEEVFRKKKQAVVMSEKAEQFEVLSGAVSKKVWRNFRFCMKSWRSFRF